MALTPKNERRPIVLMVLDSRPSNVFIRPPYLRPKLRPRGYAAGWGGQPVCRNSGIIARDTRSGQVLLPNASFRDRHDQTHQKTCEPDTEHRSNHATPT